jgi:hypothetical protein
MAMNFEFHKRLQFLEQPRQLPLIFKKYRPMELVRVSAEIKCDNRKGEKHFLGSLHKRELTFFFSKIGDSVGS